MKARGYCRCLFLETPVRLAAHKSLAFGLFLFCVCASVGHRRANHIRFPYTLSIYRRETVWQNHSGHFRFDLQVYVASRILRQKTATPSPLRLKSSWWTRSSSGLFPVIPKRCCESFLDSLSSRLIESKHPI